MIDAALSVMTGQLNQHLRRSFQVEEDLAVLSNLQEPDGAAVTQTANKLVVFLSGLERDPTAQRAPDGPSLGGAARMQAYGPVHLNLLVMCAANFSGGGYGEALKVLSAAVGFFQGRPVMDHSNAPEMHPRLEKLMFAIENLSTNDLHGLWGIHGSRYLPSVLYRVRMVSVESGQISGRAALISGAGVGVSS